MTGPKVPLRPAPRPLPKADAEFQLFDYRARGNIRFAYQILINLAMADFVTSIVYIPEIDHCKVILKIPAEHVAWVTKTLGIPN